MHLANYPVPTNARRLVWLLWLLLGPVTGLLVSFIAGEEPLREVALATAGALIGASLHRLLGFPRRGISFPLSLLIGAVTLMLLYEIAEMPYVPSTSGGLK